MNGLESTAKRAEKVQDLAKSAEESDKNGAPYKAQGPERKVNNY